MAAQEEYKTLQRLVMEALTVTSDEFQRMLPPKLRGEKEAQELYEYVAAELESRKQKCMEYISQIPLVFDGTISLEEVQKRMKRMQAIKRSADRGVVALKEELKRRKQDLDDLKKVVNDGKKVDSSLIEEVVQLCKDVKKELR